MANITSQKWLDLIFANKNKEFGAYQLRKKSAKRHNLAALFTLIGLIVIVGLVIGWSKYSAYRAELLAQAQAEKMKAAQIAAEQEAMEEQEEDIPDQLIDEPEPEIPEMEEVVETVQQTAIAIVDEVKNEARSMDENLEDNTIRDIKTQEGNTDDVDRVDMVKEQVKVETPKEEPKPEVKPEPKQEEEIFKAVEQQAQFPGGQAALSKWLSNNLKYPESAQQNNVEGRVIVQFVVEKDGSITQAKVAKGVDKDLDKEALRVVNKMPKWQPGKNNGVVVRSIFTLPVVFKLQTL